MFSRKIHLKLLYVAVSIRWISIRFDSEEEDVNRGNKLIVFNSKGSVHKF